MPTHSDSDLDQPVTAAFFPLPLFSNTLRDTPGCTLKTCCKKYMKGKRCKSCPKK